MVLVLVLILVLTFAIVKVYLMLAHQCKYWEKRGVVGPKAVPIFGNLFKFVVTKQRHIGEIYKEIYDSYAKARYVGIFKLDEPALLIRDLELVRHIMVSNFNTFNQNDFRVDPNNDPLISLNPFLSSGDTWKASRSILSPLFSPNKVRAAIPFVDKISRTMEEYIETNYDSAAGGFDVKEVAIKFTTDVIVAFGLSIDGQSFTNPDAEFRSMGNQIFQPTFLTGLKQQTVLFLPFMNKFLKIPFVPKAVDCQFRSVINRTIKQRSAENLKPKDLLTVILEKCKIHKGVDFDETFIAGHSMSVIKGAYETSSTNMAYLLHELALNPEVQSKAQVEVDEVLAESGGEITEKVLSQLEFLELCSIETARMHSPFFHTSRVSLQDFKLPAQFGDSDEKVKFEGGITTVIPIHAIHYDPNNYPEPNRFDPSRWLPENRDSIPKYAFLGFGEGPRLCIGMKFGIQQVKGGVARILSKYTVVPYERTDIPEKFSKATFNLQPENGLWLKFIRRDDAK